jgi:hypothetical protein
MQVGRAEPAKRRGRKPAPPLTEEPRPDRFIWRDGDLTIITDPDADEGAP